MKTNRSLWLRIAIVAGVLASTQAPALADTAPVAKPAPEAASQVKAPATETRITLASLSCTRVGNRMVC
ncbi:hypothetical protein FHS31_000730 [Sphingomonas vulcanisoli]|uniref:Uncharacterized protein n=1 Tax=Sphingomonas vulcanisoli TaxID=1658060 RepID=A0ABX0TNP8_9SPHN|nr:hypothetical protein [Sphingomonas vulcanisoli]NIJ07148.1 hypothetical protein [Sphingomonas vulcanisoli]